MKVLENLLERSQEAFNCYVSFNFYSVAVILTHFFCALKYDFPLLIICSTVFKIIIVWNYKNDVFFHRPLFSLMNSGGWPKLQTTVAEKSSNAFYGSCYMWLCARTASPLAIPRSQRWSWRRIWKQSIILSTVRDLAPFYYDARNNLKTIFSLQILQRRFVRKLELWSTTILSKRTLKTSGMLWLRLGIDKTKCWSSRRCSKKEKLKQIKTILFDKKISGCKMHLLEFCI